MCKKLDELIATLKAATTPVIGKADMPAGDVPTGKMPERLSPVQQAITDGQIQKAIAENGGNAPGVYDETEIMVKKALAESGININKYFIAGAGGMLRPQ